MNDTDVIVVGAGPTGLMAATLLRCCGVRVRIFDKVAQAAQESRAFGIQAKTMELMLKLGLAEEFLKRGLTATGGQIFTDGAQVAQLDFDNIGREDTPFAMLFLLPQYDTEAILGDDLRSHGVEVERPVEVLGFAQTETGVTVQVRDAAGQESAVTAAYLIGADGAHSMVRKGLGLTFEGEAYPQSFMLADCRIAWPLDYNHFRIFLRGLHLAVFLPLRGRNFGRFIAIKADGAPLSAATAEASGADPLRLEEVQHAVREATGMEVTLSDPVWMTRYRIHHRGVKEYRRGRVFVAGDAAHIHSPAGGQGMNTGLQDAANLAWKLALALRGKGGEALLESYHAERWPVGQRVLQYTDRIFTMMSSQTGWVASVRNALVPLITGTLSKSGRLRAKAFSFISQLGIRYPAGYGLRDVVSEHAPAAWREGLTPGHRAPNGLAGRHLDVFDLTAGYGFHVLAFSRRALGAEEIAALSQGLRELPAPAGFALGTSLVANSLLGRDKRLIRAESSQAFDRYGITHESPEGLFLIRPDGYIAFRSDRLKFEPLAAFLREWA